MKTIRDLHEAKGQAWAGWRHRPNGYEEGTAASDAYRAAGEALRLALPFKTSVGYAYMGRNQTGSNNGGYHIVVEEDIASGRLKRAKGDALCKPAAKFWGLDGGRTGPHALADCLVCLERAEKMLPSQELSRALDFLLNRVE